jgi:hypothetical protein
MRRRGRVPPVAAGIGALLMIAAHGASLEDGRAVFEWSSANRRNPFRINAQAASSPRDAA